MSTTVSGTPAPRTQSRIHARARRLAPVLVGLLMLGSQLPAVLAAPAQVTEEFTSITRVASFPNPVTETRSRLRMPAASTWQADPDGEILTLTVSWGHVEVLLAAGSARIERQERYPAKTMTQPLTPGTTMDLYMGDRVVVTDGYLLTVTNPGDYESIALLHRFQHP